MSNTTSVKVSPVESKVVAADVRAWAILNGYADRVKMTRGRLPIDVIAAFNKGRKGSERFTGTAGRAVKVGTARALESGKRMPYSRTVLVSDVRAWAVENGYADMTRGRMTTDTYGAYVLATAGK